MTRQRAISHLKDISMWGIVKADEYNALKMAIKALEQEPKTGHWIEGTSRNFLDSRINENVEMKKALGQGYHTYINDKCSYCGMITIHDNSILYDYCPHCGARMNEVSE